MSVRSLILLLSMLLVSRGAAKQSFVWWTANALVRVRPSDRSGLQVQQASDAPAAAGNEFESFQIVLRERFRGCAGCRPGNKRSCRTWRSGHFEQQRNNIFRAVPGFVQGFECRRRNRGLAGSPDSACGSLLSRAAKCIPIHFAARRAGVSRCGLRSMFHPKTSARTLQFSSDRSERPCDSGRDSCQSRCLGF